MKKLAQKEQKSILSYLRDFAHDSDLYSWERRLYDINEG